METVGGILLAAMALMGLLVYFIPSFMARKDVNFSKIFLLNLLGAWTGILWVVALCWAIFFARPKDREHERKERMLLNMLRSMGGSATPVEIAASTKLSTEEAKRELELLCDKGLAEVRLTDDGNLVFTVLGLLSDQERRTAKSPLDS